jgi:hypothetical protein
VTAAAAVAGAFGGATPALAAKPITVCPSGCNFAGIQDAIAAVPAGATIQIAAGTYPGGLTIDKNLTLRGAGADQTTIAGGTPVVKVRPNAVVTIGGVTVTSGSDRAGGIVNGGTLTLVGATISGNQAFDLALNGGGILNTGTLTLNSTTLSRNAAGSEGGGIYNDGGAVTLHGSTIADNRAEDGGGVFTGGGSVTVDDSLINGNTAADGGSGGGIFKGSGAALTVHGSTISGNSAQGFGGGISSADNELTVRDTTITGNAARCGGGIAVFGDLTSAFRNDTISGNTARAPFQDVFNPPTDSC